MAQHHSTGSETTPSYAPRSSRFGSEPPSVEDDVDVWRYAIASCMPQTTTTMTVDCRLFQALAAATRNTRSRSNNLLVAGTTSAYELNDLRCWLDEVDQTGKVVPYYVDTWAQEHIAYTGSFPCCSSTPRSIIWQRPKRGYTIAQRLER